MRHLDLSYPLYYHSPMAVRHKRSVSLPPELDRAVMAAAAERGTTVSAWLAETAARRLKVEVGLQAVAEWEAEHGAFTDAELASGRAWARSIVAADDGRPSKGS